jgi:uncharacterized BrkB/YihY/UPF0761 family membrane protein
MEVVNVYGMETKRRFLMAEYSSLLWTIYIVVGVSILLLSSLASVEIDEDRLHQAVALGVLFGALWPFLVVVVVILAPIFVLYRFGLRVGQTGDSND